MGCDSQLVRQACSNWMTVSPHTQGHPAPPQPIIKCCVRSGEILRSLRFDPRPHGISYLNLSFSVASTQLIKITTPPTMLSVNSLSGPRRSRIRSFLSHAPQSAAAFGSRIVTTVKGLATPKSSSLVRKEPVAENTPAIAGEKVSKAVGAGDDGEFAAVLLPTASLGWRGLEEMKSQCSGRICLPIPGTNGALSNTLDPIPIGEEGEIRGPVGGIIYNGFGTLLLRASSSTWASVANSQRF